MVSNEKRLYLGIHASRVLNLYLTCKINKEINSVIYINEVNDAQINKHDEEENLPENTTHGSRKQ